MRLELLRKRPEQAAELLRLAEELANEFDNGELLSQIYYQQSLVAEENQDFKAALIAFKKYRQYSIGMLREQTTRVGLDKRVVQNASSNRERENSSTVFEANTSMTLKNISIMLCLNPFDGGSWFSSKQSLSVQTTALSCFNMSIPIT